MKCFRLIGGIVLDGGNVRNAFFAAFFPTFPSLVFFEDSNPTNPKFGLRFFFPFHSRSSVSIRSYVRSSDSPSRQSVCLAIHLSIREASVDKCEERPIARYWFEVDSALFSTTRSFFRCVLASLQEAVNVMRNFVDAISLSLISFIIFYLLLCNG